MLSALSKLGLSGGVGFLIGLAIVSWIEPTTNGGTALLIAISVIVCMTIGGIISKLFRGNDKAAPKDEQDKAEKQETEEKALPKITSGDSSTEL